ncbi:MAG TPA: SDR family NAD(P)-dependent oxidoreductase, partial [Steroidobacteraceae bacterium]|nr:SDR family NAD(P)-dependent oxidoreductase [Steroidobacteraceae bacterium]
TALVTGAGSGIGRGLALSLAAAGCRVVLAVRRHSTGEETAALIETEGGTALVVQSDVTQEHDVAHAVERGVAAFGGLDIVVHNANAAESAHPLALEAVTAENFYAQSHVAWNGAFWLARASLPYLKKSAAGRFLLLGSAFGLHGAGFNPVYAALKGGYRGLTKALAREWGGYGITVNTIAPAAATAPTETFFNQYPQVRDAYMKNFPMGRMGRPREDIGGAVVALCTDECGFITAQSIQVDGGLYTAM